MSRGSTISSTSCVAPRSRSGRFSVLEEALASAVVEAARRDVAGKAVTPFLLACIRDATDGRSLVANTALIVNNAALAGQVAAALGSVGP